MQRVDGQVIQASRLLYLVAAEADGQKDFGQIALEVSRKFGRYVSADNVRFLVEEKLQPMGVLAAINGANPELERAKPSFELKFRFPIFSERVSQAISGVLRPLFLPPIVVAVLAGFGALDFWILFVYGLDQSVSEVFSQPVFFLMGFGILFLAGLVHEFGHAAASYYGGAKPGRIGVGIYLIWPVFYSDVTNTYRLSRMNRLRTDLGGIYFNLIYCLALAGIYFFTGYEPLLLMIFFMQFGMLDQFVPFVRFDGYYAISDLVGLPDLFRQIEPILKSMIPGRGIDKRVAKLKPWVRVVVTAWVVITIPALLGLFSWLIINTPLMVTTAWDSSLALYNEAWEAFGDNNKIDGIADLLQIGLLLLPIAGLALVYGMIGKNLCRFLGKLVWSKTKGRPTLRYGFLFSAMVAAGVALFVWWQPEKTVPTVSSASSTEETAEAANNTPADLETAKKVTPASQNPLPSGAANPSSATAAPAVMSADSLPTEDPFIEKVEQTNKNYPVISLPSADPGKTDLTSNHRPIKPNLSAANMSGANLGDADLYGANLHRADLSGTNLRNANLRNAKLSGADLRGADLRGADLSGVNLRNARVTNAQLASCRSLALAIMPDGSEVGP